MVNMIWSKWWPRLAEIPAVTLAAVAIVLQILRYSKIWTAPVDPIDQAVLLVALLVVSFFALRKHIERLERSIEEVRTTSYFSPIQGRKDVDEAAVNILRDSSVPKNERNIYLVTVISPRGLEQDQIRKESRSSQLMNAALDQKIKDGWRARRLIIVRNKKDLDFVVTWYITPFNALTESNYEVRVLANRDTLPPTPLLIVGRERMLIGLFGDGAGGVMKGALILHGSEPTALARRHFQTLWEWPGIHRLRPYETNGLSQVAYEQICEEL